MEPLFGGDKTYKWILFLAAVIHIVICPFTKVEESFNLQVRIPGRECCRYQVCRNKKNEFYVFILTRLLYVEGGGGRCCNIVYWFQKWGVIRNPSRLVAWGFLEVCRGQNKEKYIIPLFALFKAVTLKYIIIIIMCTKRCILSTQMNNEITS